MTFSPGSTVQLKSGGPVMTVEKSDERHAVCVWREGKELKRHTLSLVILEAYKKLAPQRPKAKP